MPAIQLARLKIQVTELLSHFEDPELFSRELDTMLDFYADRTRRPGQSGKPKPLIRAYNVPRQVMRRIESDITPLVAGDTEHAITLMDYLWADAYYESRLLAIAILGEIPLQAPEIILDRLQTWRKTCRDDDLLDALMDKGAAPIRIQDPDQYFSLIENWLSSTEAQSRKLGLRALPSLVENPTFENLPALFRLLSPFVRESLSTLETELIQVIRSLGLRSPQETTYFLQQNLRSPHKTGLEVITRRSMDIFPSENADVLKAELRNQMRKSTGG